MKTSSASEMDETAMDADSVVTKYESGKKIKDAANPVALRRFIDLFCGGMGAFRLALQGLGLTCVFSSDIAPGARATYKANYGEEPAGDITQIRAESIPAHDILCAGFCCQAFSIAGKKLGFRDKTRGTLFFEIVRIAEHGHPKVIFLENVPNLVSHDRGRTFETIVGALRDAGYIVFHRIISASHYGCPTARKRIYIVAFRSDLGVTDFVFPTPPMRPAAISDVLLPDSDPRLCGLVVDRDNIVLRGDVPDSDREKLFVARCIGKVAGGGQGYRIYSTKRPAVTFCANGGGLGGRSGLYYVNRKVRRLHSRECARAMGFPDTFVLPESDSPAKALIGNSIAVPVVEAIGQRILDALANSTSIVKEVS